MAPRLTLTLWVHDNVRDTAGSSSGAGSTPLSSSLNPSYPYGVPLASHLFNEVILNPELLRGESPQLKEGDVVELSKAANSNSSGSASASRGNVEDPETRCDTLMFIICKPSIAPEGGSAQLQISISQNLAQAFGFKNRDQVVLTKLPSPLPKEYIADHVELYFKDQYLGRADMHRISLALADSCIYKEQKVQLAGLNVRARIGGIWVKGKQRNSALVTCDTRTVFRSESAKYYIFLQLSKEMWHFDDDGSLFFEKALDLFLPELFSRWSKRSTNHIVSVVLFARIMYDQDETTTVQRPMMKYGDQSPEAGKWTDMYKVIVDLENLMSWKNVLYLLRKDIQNFREEVYLASRPRPDERLAGSISWAHEGGILEAVNMALSAFNKHYIDRDLQRTGLSIVIVTAGTAHFNVDKNLLRLTTERMIDEGFGVDLVSLAKMPLHAVPLFRYDGTVPAKDEGKTVDLLYTEDKDPLQKKERLYAIPHWIDSSFYAKHQDKPFRCDRFLPRCRMSNIQTMGIADYENASISLPLINDELKLLEGYGPEWEQLSEIEKKRKTWARFDAIACGSLGKWEKIHQEEQKNQYASRMKGFTSGSDNGGRNSRNSDINLLGSSDQSSDDEMARKRRESSDISGSRVTNSDSTDTALAFAPRGREERGRPMPNRFERPAAIHISDARPVSANIAESPTNGSAPPPGSPRDPKARKGRSLSRPASSAPRRPRADSSASSATLFKRPSHLNLRSPSIVAASTAKDLLADEKTRPSATPLDRRSASYVSHSAVAAHKVAPTISATAALASVMAAQNKKDTSTSTTSTFAGGWFWNRKKASATNPQAKNPTPLPSTGSRDDAREGDAPDSARHQAPADSPPASVISRKSSLLSMPKPATSLSVTPATPSTATTTTASTNSHLTAHSRLAGQPAQPISIGPTPAAFTITTNDIMSDPRSLDSHSIQQHFFEAARLAGLSTRNLKNRIDLEKKRRITRLNPSNPSRSSVMLQDQSRRWINIFPRAGRINNQRSVKWKSLCTPACLPLYTDYMPSIEELSESYTKDTYSLPVTTGMGSFLLRPGRDIKETAGNLLRELVNQRLSQSFQIIMPAYEDLPRTPLGHSRKQSDSGFVLPSAADIREILYNTSRGEGQSVFLGFSTVVHRLRFDRLSASVVITSWSQKKEWSTKPYDYSFMLMPFGSQAYGPRSVTFSYPNLNAYDWQYMDRLVAGMEAPKLQEKTRYWRTRFILLPTAVPDLQAMIQSQSKVLLEDSTEDDLRIAGVMTLYELFSKAMWQPANKANRYRSTLVYTTTTYDPSIYAAEEVERLTSESAIVPLPEAYTEDKFFEDLSAQQIVQAMLDGPRPVRLQARRSGFRKIEDSFTGQDFVAWLVEEFVDVPDRATALIVGNELIQAGVVEPIVPPKRLLDSYTFYQIAQKYRPQVAQKPKSKGWSTSILGESETLPTVSNIPSSSMYQSLEGTNSMSEAPALRYTEDQRVIFPMSNCTIINLDPQQKSDRSETAFLHLDVAHNPANGFHFQLNWLGTSRLVDDMLSHWQRMAEKHGLKLVEENVRQIKDISHDNPLQAASRIRLALPPPLVPNLGELLGPGNVQNAYFQTQLLRDLGYILDVEADSNFPQTIQAEYSYSKEAFQTSQFIHKSGTCFVQILDDEDGFLLLRNRLYLSHRQINWSAKTTVSVAAAASDPGELKKQLQEICENPEELNRRWEDILDGLTSGESTAAGSGSVKSGSTNRPNETPAELPLPLSLPESLPSLAESEEEDP